MPAMFGETIMTITAKELREATARGEGPLAKAHDDEPVFLLRGQDCHAADLVEKWAIWAGAAVPTVGGSEVNHKVQEAILIADFMRRWPIHKQPD
jgi:hypothetical protein